MALKDAFVNIAQGAATSIANRAVSSVVQGVAAGLKGSNPSNSTNKLGAMSKPSPILSYPENVAEDPMQGHYILFGIRKNEPGKFDNKPTASQKDHIAKLVKSMGGKDASLVSQNYIDRLSKSKVKDQQAANVKTKAKSQKSLTMRTRPSTQVIQHIALYMPPQVSVSYGANYAEQEIGLGAEVGMKAYQGLFGPGSTTFGDFYKATGDAALGAAKSAGLGLLDSVAPGAKALVSLERGKVIAPRIELMFEGIGRRDYEFSFVFIPKSAAEAQQVKEIVKLFKKHMSPETSTTFFGGTETVRELKIPDVFDINYMYRGQENQYLNKIGTSYLKSVQVSYGGDRYTAYEPDASGSPPPQRTSLTLSFSEIEIMYRDRIEEGY